VKDIGETCWYQQACVSSHAQAQFHPLPMLEAAEDESELAGVIAHEMANVPRAMVTS